MIKNITFLFLIVTFTVSCNFSPKPVTNESTSIKGSFTIRHTGIDKFYDTISTIPRPDLSSLFYNQDARFVNVKNGFQLKPDNTVYDSITGLTWQRLPTPKITLKEAKKRLNELNRGIYHDWRIPSIKELFSLIDYKGRVFGDKSIRLFIDTNYFVQPKGNLAAGEREIDAQTLSATTCKSITMGKDESQYGVNFVDGRLKAYPIIDPFSGNPNKLHFRFVRGNPSYGLNQFRDNGDGTITDSSTGLMWQKKDCKTPLDWYKSLQYAHDLKLAGHTDWRLPNIKELQSIVDYDLSVERDKRPAINPIFETSIRNDPDGSLNYPFYWSSTTILDGPEPGNLALYVCFGKATARFNNRYVNAHGEGAVRSDPKTIDNQVYPIYFGPQGDAQYVLNYVRCVRSTK